MYEKKEEIIKVLDVSDDRRGWKMKKKIEEERRKTQNHDIYLKRKIVVDYYQ